MRRIIWKFLPFAIVWALVVWFLQKVWFYRDPVRVAPTDANLIVSPCDGQVVYVRKIEEGKVYAEKLGERIDVTEITKEDIPEGVNGWLVGVYMSPLDVHFNYAPITGTIDKITHIQTGMNLPMVDLWEYIQLTYLRKAVDLFAKKYELMNERQTVFMHNEHISLAMVEIADKFVNKITTYVSEQDHVQAGQKVSFIERGSQVDLVIFSDDIEFLIKVGDQVYGAQTPLARLKNLPQIAE